MSPNHTRYKLHEQMTVWDAEGERVGHISALGEERFFIAHGPALHERVATHADILEVRFDDVFLNVPRAALRRVGPLSSDEEQTGWRTAPAESLP